MAVGPVQVYLELHTIKPSLNFLYAMVGALEGRHWAEIAREERLRLLIKLDSYSEIKSIFEED